MLINTKNLMRYSLHAKDGAIGEIIDICFDDEWTVRYFAADTGRWLPGRQVLLSPVSLNEPERGNRILPVDLTREQVRQSPGIELGRRITRHHEQKLHSHYRWPVYWEDSEKPVTNPEAPDVSTPEQEEETGHIRSVRDLIGFGIAGLDNGIGHVDDVILDISSWQVRYLVAGTRNILTVREKLLDVTSGLHIDWDNEQVALDFTREALMNAPPYVSPDEIDTEYETKLAEYYSRVIEQ